MTTDLDAKFPEVEYARSARGFFDDLVGEEWSPFKGRTRADVFVFSMAYAFSQSMRRKPLGKDPLKLPPSAFDMEKRTLMRSLAIHTEKDVHVVKNNRDVIKICTEYSNAAIEHIYNSLYNKQPENTSENVLEKFVQEAVDRNDT